MRSNRNRRPHWKTLNVILIVAVGLLIAQHTLHFTPTGRKIALCFIVIAIYGWMGLWVKSNATALEDLDAEEYRKQSGNPAVYGTPQFPTRAQSHFQETVSLYRHETPDKQERR